jgi:ABC-type amino acid transport substrate-binding protein
MEENKGIYRVLEIVKSERELNIVFPKGSLLRDEVNRILAEMREDGTYQNIYDKWFSYQ